MARKEKIQERRQKEGMNKGRKERKKSKKTKGGSRERENERR